MDLWPCVVCNESWLPYADDFSHYLCALCQTLLSFSSCLRCYKLFERNLLASTAKWRISPQETVRQIVSVSPLINLGYFIVPCNLISQHGYLCLKCLKLKCDGTEGIQNPGVALPREHISLSVYAYVCFSVKLCSCVRQKRGQMFLVWLHPLWLLSECWHD